MKPASRKAFADIYDDHIWDVYGFIGYRVASRELAEDLTQATFERALRAWGRFDPSRASARTWLLTIARNLVIDHYRQDRSSDLEELNEDDLPASGPNSEYPEASLGVDPELAEALTRLAPRDRELIALRFGGDLTGPEIAELTGLTLANVQQILSRSLRRLRTELAGPPQSTGRSQASR